MFKVFYSSVLLTLISSAQVKATYILVNYVVLAVHHYYVVFGPPFKQVREILHNGIFNTDALMIGQDVGEDGPEFFQLRTVKHNIDQRVWQA